MANLNQFAFHETNTPFPKIILLRDNRPCAAIGYLAESTDTMVVAQPVVFPDASPEVHREICVRLLEHVKRHAVSEKMHRLHLLVAASDSDAGFALLLAELGFVQATRIVQWDLSMAWTGQCLPQARGTFELYDFAENSGDACEIRFAIDAILKSSADLSSQPPPAVKLLTQWQRLQARLFVFRVEQEIAGLMSCVTHPLRSSADTSPAHTLSSETDVCIEYIGVVPAFRRKQIASSMISRIPGQLSSDFDVHNPQALRVTAYSDIANIPASLLYQSCGFVPTTGPHLWCCDLAKFNDDADA